MAWLGNTFVGLAVTLGLGFPGFSNITYYERPPDPLPEPPTFEEKILASFDEDGKKMLAIAKCESGQKQEAVSPTADFGYFQINEWHWDSTAKELGLDYKNDIDDNLAMAIIIYEKEGLSAWVCAEILGLI